MRRALTGPWPVALLLLLVVLPLPISLPGAQAFDPGLVWPRAWLLLGAVGCMAAWLWEVSGPTALFLLFVVWRTVDSGTSTTSAGSLAFVLGALWLFGWSARRRLDRVLTVGCWLALSVVTLAGLCDVLRVVPTINGWPLWVLLDPRLAGKPHGLMGHPNDFAVFVAMVVPVVIPMCWRACDVQLKALRRLSDADGFAVVLRLLTLGVVVVVPGILGALLVISGTKAAFVALTVAAALAIWCWTPRLRSACIVLGALMALTIPFTLWFRPVADWNALMGGRVPVLTLGFDAWWGWHRWAGWGLGLWPIWVHDPFGPIRSGAAWVGLLPQNAFTAWWEEAFCDPLQTLFELGPIGLTLCVAFVAQVIARGLAAASTDPRRVWMLVVVIAAVSSLAHPVVHRPPMMVLAMLAAGQVLAHED